MKLCIEMPHGISSEMTHGCRVRRRNKKKKKIWRNIYNTCRDRKTEQERLSNVFLKKKNRVCLNVLGNMDGNVYNCSICVINVVYIGICSLVYTNLIPGLVGFV